MCMCARARVWIRTCPTSWAWLRACFVRCQPHSLKAKHSSDRNHTLCLIWLCLQSEQFVFALHQWAHQQLSSPLSPSAPMCVRVCALVCISVYSTEHTWTWRTLVFLCVCGWRSTQRVAAAALTTSPTEICQSPGYDRPYLVSASTAGLFHNTCLS